MISISADNIASTTAYISEIFNDVKPLFFVVVGLMLGMWILKALIDIFWKIKRGE